MHRLINCHVRDLIPYSMLFVRPFVCLPLRRNDKKILGLHNMMWGQNMIAQNNKITTSCITYWVVVSEHTVFHCLEKEKVAIEYISVWILVSLLMQPQINWDTVKNFMHEKTDYKDEKISVSGGRRQLHHYLQLEVVF